MGEKARREGRKEGKEEVEPAWFSGRRHFGFGMLLDARSDWKTRERRRMMMRRNS